MLIQLHMSIFEKFMYASEGKYGYFRPVIKEVEKVFLTQWGEESILFLTVLLFLSYCLYFLAIDPAVFSVICSFQDFSCRK